jgi:AcrR family transcriptional regulator
MAPGPEADGPHGRQADGPPREAPPSDGNGFRRPTREDAIALSREYFLSGKRVEMQTVSTGLGIGRTTLYRWVGEREQLLEEVFAGLVDEWFAEVVPQETGTGREGLLGVMRSFLEFAAAAEPLSEFAAREPALTMRLLLDREGLIARHSRAQIGNLLGKFTPELEVPENIIDAIEMSAASLVWANIAIGREPDIEGAIELCDTLLGVCADKS